MVVRSYMTCAHDGSGDHLHHKDTFTDILKPRVPQEQSAQLVYLVMIQVMVDELLRLRAIHHRIQSAVGDESQCGRQQQPQPCPFPCRGEPYNINKV